MIPHDITPPKSETAVAELQPEAEAVRPDELGLRRFSRSIHSIFFPGWHGFPNWRIRSVEDTNWSICCDHKTRTVSFGDLICADRDAFRALLILGLVIAETSSFAQFECRARLMQIRDMADFIRRHQLARYLDDLILGVDNGDLSFENGSMLWAYTSIESLRPAREANEIESYDKLFEDSLLFSDLKRMLEAEASDKSA